MRNTRESRSISSSIASRRASRYRRVGMGGSIRERAFVSGRFQIREGGIGALVGELDGVDDLGLDALLQRIEPVLAQALLAQRRARAVQRVALLVLLEL